MVSANSPAPNQVQNSVINALLEAFYDVLDLDGKRSLLDFAGLSELMDSRLPPRGTSNWGIFLKLLNAMRTLLQFSDRILFEIGRKFSIYLDPCGSSFPDFIERLNDQFHELELHITPHSRSEYEITVSASENRSALFSDTWMHYFYRGVFMEGLRKSIGGEIIVDNTQCDDNSLHIIVKSK